MIKSNFREWTLDKIDETFGTQFQLEALPSLTKLISYQYTLNDYELKFLDDLRGNYRLGGESWNEVELENKIISPLIVFSGIDNQKFAYFLERNLSTTIGDYELSGRVDGMIATGFRNPKEPYFCMNEYKRATDPHGDPQGQALIAMLVAQAINKDNHPIYGCYIVGKQWTFIVLEEKKYSFSNSYTVDDNGIYDIYRIFKGLKWCVDGMIGE